MLNQQYLQHADADFLTIKLPPLLILQSTGVTRMDSRLASNHYQWFSTEQY